MLTVNNYDEWLDSFYGLKPHRFKHDASFNNVVFSTELLLAKKALGILNDDDLALYLGHLQLMDTEDGLYAPKNSHDNLTAKFVGLLALESVKVKKVNLKAARKGKHPRDSILWGLWLTSNPLYWLLLFIPMLDMVRAILSSGKVRPKWYDTKYFWFRVKAKLGIIKPYKEEQISGGLAEHYMYGGAEERIIYVQNDGKILNLLRLHALKDYWVLKPFVRFCKWLYVKKMGADFQTQLMANYFEESDHPVRVAYAELDRQGKTVIDC